MKSLVDHLAQYAAYHRDPRNIATHLVGIPMIVAGAAILLSRPSIAIDGAGVTPAMLVCALLALFYLWLDLRLGTMMTLLLAIAAWGGLLVSRQGTGPWLALGLGPFVIGWAIQLVGHHYEGRKPAFLDDVAGLIIGPLFVVAEIAFRCGLRPRLQAAIEARTMRR